MALRPDDSLAVLESLTPESGWETDVAMVATYSLDLVAAAALVTALGGEGDDEEQVRRPGLARAAAKLRDKFRVVCQGGRIAIPSRGGETLVLADRWVRTVGHDGRVRSWHPKFTLVRYVPRSPKADQPQFRWRLWIGSRNLTRDVSWDSALVAEGEPAAGPGSESIGIAALGAELANRCALPNWTEERVQTELRGVRWRWPPTVLSVESVRLWHSGEAGLGLPPAPAGTRTLIAVSPFIDATTIRHLANWGGAGTSRVLLTTPACLRDLAAKARPALTHFVRLHTIDSAPPADAPEPESTGADQMKEPNRGLHAKLLWYSATDGDHLWLGSANLTDRAWSGKNSEAMIHLRVAPVLGVELRSGLVDNVSRLVPLEDLPSDATPADPREALADAIRNRIASNWNGTLRAAPDGAWELVLSAPPLLPTEDAELAVKLVGAPTTQNWPKGAAFVTLPARRLHQLTELVELRLSIRGDPPVRVGWVARAEMDPPPTMERDDAVLARLMGPAAFLRWLRQMLDEAMGDEDGELWPERKGPFDRATGRAAWNGTGLPTLEGVLRAWSRDPSVVTRLDRAVVTWASDIRQHAADSEDERDRAALAQLDVFLAQWTVLRDGLGAGGGRS